MSQRPLVSCLCCTYGRPVFLGESIRCFLDQDYNNKELIILNDQEGVHLKVYPYLPDNIRIYEHPNRFPSLGQKRNYLKSLARGKYCCIWDDDDLYVPFRISESVYFIEQNPDCDILKPKDAFISIGNEKYKVASNRFHAQAIITKEFIDNHMYPSISIGEDKVFEDLAKVKYVDIYPSIWSVFRWKIKDVYNVSSVLSSMEKTSWESVLTYAPYNNIKGDVWVKPEFQHDYWSDLRKVYNDINGFWGEEWYKKIGRSN